MVFIGYVVNKSDLTDKTDLTGFRLVGQEKVSSENPLGSGREKAAANRDDRFAFIVL